MCTITDLNAHISNGLDFFFHMPYFGVQSHLLRRPKLLPLHHMATTSKVLQKRTLNTILEDEIIIR